MIDSDFLEKIETLNLKFLLGKILLDVVFKPYYITPLDEYPMELLPSSYQLEIPQNNMVEASSELETKTGSLSNPRECRQIFKAVSTSIVESNQIKPITKKKKLQKPKYNYRSDCIRKRIKSHVNKYILYRMNLILAKLDSDFYILKLSKDFITNMRIDSNRILMKKTIKEIYSSIYPECSNYIKSIKHNVKVINQIYLSHEKFQKFVNLTFSEAYQEYLQSNEFKKDLLYLELREGKQYVERFKMISDSYLKYYE